MIQPVAKWFDQFENDKNQLREYANQFELLNDFIPKYRVKKSTWSWETGGNCPTVVYVESFHFRLSQFTLGWVISL